MSTHPQGGHYDDGYGHQPPTTDSYYQDDQNQSYYDNHQEYPQQAHAGQHQDYQQHQQSHGGGGYYDESCVIHHSVRIDPKLTLKGAITMRMPTIHISKKVATMMASSRLIRMNIITTSTTIKVHPPLVSKLSMVRQAMGAFFQN